MLVYVTMVTILSLKPDWVNIVTMVIAKLKVRHVIVKFNDYIATCTVSIAVNLGHLNCAISPYLLHIALSHCQLR